MSKTLQELRMLLIVRQHRFHEFRFSVVKIVISVSNVTRLWDCLCHCLCHCLCLCICLCHCIFFGQVMSPNHSDQMSQRSHSQVSTVALWRCSLNIFVFVIVFILVFVFFIVFFLVRLCPLITLIKCLKGHKSLGSLFEGVL